MNDEILIFSYRIAKDLMKSGFVAKDVRANTKIKNRTVFVFLDNDKIRNYLKENHNMTINK